MKHVKKHKSMEAAWSYLLHLEEEVSAQQEEEELVEKALTEQEEIPDDEQLLHLNDGAKLVICMVGKPARGKTFLGSKIQRYCEWLGYKVKHVETVQMRREMFGKVEPDDFFDPNSIEMTEHRKAAQEKSLATAIEWLQKGGGQVVIYDATNSTRARRKEVKEYVEKSLGSGGGDVPNAVAPYRILWVESLCEDNDLIVQNFMELRKKNPGFTEYKDLNDEQAVQKFLEKLKFYDNEYQALDSAQEDISYMKMIDFGKSLHVNKIQGYLESKLVAFAINIHTHPRVIILVRHGQSEYNLQDRIGGDPSITDAGREFSKNLAKFIDKQAPRGFQDRKKIKKGENNPYAFDPSKDLHVWTSNLRRTIESTKHVKCLANLPWAALSEIDAGVCECMTYKDFKEKLATQYMKRQRNKAAWRYPGGESYLDVKKRLEPVIFELERQRKPILVCAHRAVLRCLYSYFQGISITRAPFLPFPLHTCMVLTPTSDGWSEDRFPIEPNVGDLGAHEQDVQAAAAKILKNKAKKRRLAQEKSKVNASSTSSSSSSKK